MDDSHSDRLLDALLAEVRLLVIVLVSGPVVAGLSTPFLLEDRGFVGVLLSSLALALGFAVFVLFLGTGALGTARMPTATALATVSLLAGYGLSLVVGAGVYGIEPVLWSQGANLIGWVRAFAEATVGSLGSGGAILATGSGIAAGAWATRIARSVN